MLQNTQKHTEYVNAAFGFSLLSIIGALFSIMNIIPLIITYRLLEAAKKHGIADQKLKLISYLFGLALILTLVTSIFYITFQY